MRTPIIILSLLALVPVVRGGNPPSGKIIGNVVCEADATHRYALYVPADYSPERRWPVIFCFDPVARGHIPVERLKVAADKYGYILAGSLTSRNGPYAANVTAAQAMVKDVSARFSIDPQRIHTAGMSGGARVATSIALSGFVNGVIACGAGFPVLDDGIPSRVPFVFFGIVGVEDFNFAELRRLDGELEQRGAVHRIATFEGGHVWTPEPMLTQAVEWLELQAMRAGKKDRDEAFIQTMLARRQTELARFSGAEKWRAAKAIVADFSGLVATEDFAQQAALLGASREVKDALKTEKRLLLREPGLVDELRDAAEGSLARKQAVAAKFRQRAEAASDPAERAMMHRAIAGYCMFAQEATRDLLGQKNYQGAADMLELVVALRPEQARGWFDLSRAYAFSGDKDAALESLGRAAENGFDDDARLAREPAFEKLRTEARFQEILSRVRANVRVPVTALPGMGFPAAREA